MKRSDDERRPIFGVGGTASKDPHSWRPSKALREQEESQRESQLRAGNSEQSGAAPDAPATDAGEWRPSEAVKGRLRSLASVCGRRRFTVPRYVRLVTSAVLFVIGMYAFVKLWTIPTEMDLHPALVVFAIALVLLLIAAIVSAVYRRRRAREDENSTLRL